MQLQCDFDFKAYNLTIFLRVFPLCIRFLGMKLQPDRHAGLSVTAYAEGWIAVNGSRYSHDLLISSSGTLLAWPVKDFKHLQSDHLSWLWETRADILLIGCSSKTPRPDHVSLFPLIEKGMGTEVMDTAAACRTFNILAAEGRRVAAVLMLA